MPTAIQTPRVNNNDDSVRFSYIHAAAGSAVKAGDPVAEIETDKATFIVEAEREGFVLGFVQELGEMITVGSVLAWIGDSADEPMPVVPLETTVNSLLVEPTLKASLLLSKFGLDRKDVPASGEQLTAQDVLSYVELRRSAPKPTQEPSDSISDLPAGHTIPLTIASRGMLKTVLWHRDSAVPGYVEMQYETEPWQHYADSFQARHRLLLSPVLQLMAYRLVHLAGKNPKLNTTIRGDEQYRYNAVNLGFTLQSGSNLYLLSVQDADKMDEKTFVDTLTILMRHGMKSKLEPSMISGSTLSFSSMARWEVVRHIPILPPYTSLIVAHTHPVNGIASLGCTYDHRVLTGGEAAAALRELRQPSTGD